MSYSPKFIPYSPTMSLVMFSTENCPRLRPCSLLVVPHIAPLGCWHPQALEAFLMPSVHCLHYSLPTCSWPPSTMFCVSAWTSYSLSCFYQWLFCPLVEPNSSFEPFPATCLLLNSDFLGIFGLSTRDVAMNKKCSCLCKIYILIEGYW